MKVRVEYAPVLENEVVLRCPRLDQEMLRVLSLVRSGLQKLCVWDENREIILLSPDETLYCESVDEHTFLYTASAFIRRPSPWRSWRGGMESWAISGSASPLLSTCTASAA